MFPFIPTITITYTSFIISIMFFISTILIISYFNNLYHLSFRNLYHLSFHHFNHSLCSHQLYYSHHHLHFHNLYYLYHPLHYIHFFFSISSFPPITSSPLSLHSLYLLYFQYSYFYHQFFLFSIISEYK